MSHPNPSIQQSSSSRLLQIDLGVLIPAILAVTVVQLFRSENYSWVPAIWIETAFFLVFPFLFFWINEKWFGVFKPNSKSSLYRCQGGAVAVIALTIVWQVAGRVSGLGDANEIIALLILQNVAWFLAVFCRIHKFEKTSLILFSSIVFLVCSISERGLIFVLTGIYAIVFLWWLAGLYWNRLGDKTIDGSSKTLPIRSAAIAVAVSVIGAIATIVSLVPGLSNQLQVTGFMPFSGGEHGYEDQYARSGFGDGHMLAAGDNATTTGAVDSDTFIQDHKESLYDVSLEKFDGPVFKRASKNRSIPLDVIAKHIHNVKQSEQSGRTFRTMRESDKVSDLKLESKTTEALFYVEGSVPVRFAVDSFNNFDGWDWTKEEIPDSDFVLPRIQLQTVWTDGPVYQICLAKSKFMTNTRKHKIKMMRFKDSTLPSPSFLDRWRIARVAAPNLFRWNDAGLIRMDGEFIPTHTVIDTESLVPNFHLVRASSSWYSSAAKDRILNAEENSGSVFLQIPDSSGQSYVARLADEWTSSIEPGWKQVEVIVDNLRNQFELNSHWTSDETAADTVSHFISQGGGPSYMFATTCAMMLRSQGYQTRLTRGFVLQKSDYDRKSQQSITTSENVHFWPEVCIDGKHWIPVEPTPGYPQPYSTATGWQRISSSLLSIWNWCKQHPVSIGLAVAGVCLVTLFRIRLITWLMLCWWHLVRLLWPSKLLSATRKLIDVRFWAAGDRRPESETIQSWYSRIENGLSTGFFNLWSAKNYSDRTMIADRSEVSIKCREQVQALGFNRIKQFIQQKISDD